MNNNIKSKMRDDIIVQMQQYLDNNTLQILDSGFKCSNTAIFLLPP